MRASHIFFIGLFLVGCQSMNNESAHDLDEDRAYGLIKQQRQTISQLTEENEVLMVLREKPKKLKPTELRTYVEIQVPGGSAVKVYNFIVRSWKENNYDAVLAGVNILKTKHHRIELKNRSLYWLAKLDFRLKKYTSVLSGLGEIQKSSSNKKLLSKANYLKAQVYRKMNLTGAYVFSLKEVLKQGPGVSVYKKAQVELSKIQ